MNSCNTFPQTSKTGNTQANIIPFLCIPSTICNICFPTRGKLPQVTVDHRFPSRQVAASCRVWPVAACYRKLPQVAAGQLTASCRKLPRLSGRQVAASYRNLPQVAAEPSLPRGSRQVAVTCRNLPQLAVRGKLRQVTVSCRGCQKQVTASYRNLPQDAGRVGSAVQKPAEGLGILNDSDFGQGPKP